MTTQDYLDQLESDRSDMVDNLETQGITGLTGDETFTELVPEILNISVGGEVNAYRVESTTERDNLTSVKSGDVCLIYIPENTQQGTPCSYLGLYIYDGSSWQLLPLGNTATGSEVLSGYTEAVSSGLVQGSFPDYSSMRDLVLVMTYAKHTIVLPSNSSNYFEGLNADEITLSVDGSAATNLTNLFKNSTIKTLDLSTWNLSKVTTFTNMFSGVTTLKTLKIGNFKSQLTVSIPLPTTLTSLSGTGNLGFFSNNHFTSLTNLTSVNLSGTCYSNYGYVRSLFKGLTNLTSATFNVYIDGNSSKEIYRLFENCTSLRTANISGINCSGSSLGFSSFLSMFKGCSSLTSVTLPSSVYARGGFGSMFEGCSSLRTVTIPTLTPAGSGYGMNYNDMFKGCVALRTVNASRMTLLQTTNVSGMFYGCTSLTTLDLHTWGSTTETASQHPALDNLFYGCTALTKIDIRNLDFYGYTSLPNTMFGTGDYKIPADCNIIVKDNDNKDKLEAAFSWLTNIQTVAEYEASQSS